MKLIDDILEGGCPIATVDEASWKAMPVVLANEVARLYWSMAASPPMARIDELGHLIPRYPRMWIEWVAPQDIPFTDGTMLRDLGHEAHNLTMGAVVTSEQRDDGFHLEILPFSRANDHADVVVIPQIIEVEVDSEGRYQGARDEAGSPLLNVQVFPDVAGTDTDPARMARGFTIHVVKTALLAVSLMNCRNVEIMDMAHSDKTQKARKRRSKRHIEPIQRWSIIRLPDKVRRSLSKAEVKEHLGGTVPAHIVAAHFKTYTDDNKLFGKHVGRYFWSSFVRGNAEAGHIRRIVQVEPERVS